MEIKSLKELRADFELMAENNHFNIEKNSYGEYTYPTLFLWAGYKECAAKHGILTEAETSKWAKRL